jgi:hypothetical protein
VDIEGVIAIIGLFGGGTLVLLGFSPIGRALADRIRGRAASADEVRADLAEHRDTTEAELEALRGQVSELAERLDFAERLLAQHRAPERLGGPS